MLSFLEESRMRSKAKVSTRCDPASVELFRDMKADEGGEMMG